jgi:hypothetical protein
MGAMTGQRWKTAWASAVSAGVLLAGAVGCGDTTVHVTIPPGARVDDFQQVLIGKVDILWIVDNSGSMADKQKNLADNFPEFFKVINDSKVDYHVGIITTDTVNMPGQLVGTPKVITSSTPDPVGTFAKNVNVGTLGNALDTGLGAARLFFQTPDPSFLRPDAFLFMIFISDADDQSLPADPHYFYRLFEGLKGKGNENMVTTNGIVGDVPNGCFNAAGGWKARPGIRYAQVMSLTGGSVVSICEPSFGASLKQLGIDAVGLQRHFAIKNPNASTLKVTATYPCDADPQKLADVCSARTQCDGTTQTITCTVKQAMDDTSVGWVYQSLPSPNIFFQGDSVPPKGSHIQVTYYEFGKAPPQ